MISIYSNRSKKSPFYSRRMLTFFLLLLILIYLVTLTACSRKIEPVSKTGFAFNTVITITLYENEKKSEELITNCFSMCSEYENLFSRTIEGSDIWNVNHSDGQPVTVSEDTISLLQTALKYSELSDGMVDPTIGALSEAWNFSEQSSAEHPVIPPDDSIQEMLKHVDYKNIEISDSTVTLKDPEAMLDLGFLAKGYIADQLKNYLVSEGISSAIINLGGNVLTIGDKPDGSTFNIGIQKPFDQMNKPLLSLPVSDSSVVSSGCYERFFTVDGKLYHHILDTSTGFPVENNLYGVTILSKQSTDGDALSTLVYALGLEDGMKLIEATPDVEAIFVTDTYEIYKSSGIK